MASESIKVIKKVRKLRTRRNERPLKISEIYELIRVLDSTFGVHPRVSISKRSRRNYCYDRKPVMQLSKKPTKADVLEEYSHALQEARQRAEMKPHGVQYHQALDEVLKALQAAKEPFQLPADPLQAQSLIKRTLVRLVDPKEQAEE